MAALARVAAEVPEPVPLICGINTSRFADTLAFLLPIIEINQLVH